MKILAWVETKKGNEFQVELPATRIVCPRCNGEGSHVNPAIDGHGLTAEDFDQDPDFLESYMAGHYDVQCEECKGKRVVDVVDVEALTPKMRDRLFRAIQTRHRNARDY